MRPLGAAAVGNTGCFARVLRDDHAATTFVSNDGASWRPIGRTPGYVETTPT
jgi:hypothetical protein